MKQIIFFLLSLISVAVTAQNKMRQYNTIDYTPFIGKWTYQNQDTVFVIELKPVVITGEGKTYTIEQLYGGYSIKVNGITKVSCMGVFPDTIFFREKYRNTYNMGISAYQYGDVDALIPGMLKTTFYDMEKKHNGGHGIKGGEIFLLSSDSILWTLNEVTGAEKYDVPFENLGFSVPTNAVMKKDEPNNSDQQSIKRYRTMQLQRKLQNEVVTYATELDAVAGTWRYESNDTVFRIKFKKELINESYWVLTGSYELNIKGSSLNNDNDIDSNKAHLFASTYNGHEEESKKKILHLIIRDRIKHHNHGAGIRWGRIIPLSSDTIHWDLRPERKQQRNIPVFSVPTNVIMTKEE